MLIFYNNRMGCLASLAISIVGSAVLLLIMYACSGGAAWLR